MSLRILSYNVRRGGSGREQLLAAVIRDADVDLVVFQEATSLRVVARLATLITDSTSTLPALDDPWHTSVVSRSRATDGYVHGSPNTRSSRSFPVDSIVRVIGVHLSAVHAAWTERRRVHELRDSWPTSPEVRQGRMSSSATSTLSPPTSSLTSRGCRVGFGCSCG